jgi:hypothetical protein
MENSSMITVHLKDPGLACQAVEWCEENIPSDIWKFDMFWPASGYDFIFKDSKTATLFSLKWAGSI